MHRRRLRSTCVVSPASGGKACGVTPFPTWNRPRHPYWYGGKVD